MLNYVCRGNASTPGWEKPADMPDILWRLLRARGIAGEEEARCYLDPSQDQLLSSYALSCMEQAVCRIRSAVQNRERVWVWGDYDVDGVCAAAILTTALRHLGLSPEHHIPTRQEGYGLNEAGIRDIHKKGCNLLITVDCGITACDEISIARSLGLDVIVTDHHLTGPALPDCPVINPQLNNYPNPSLCGAGVAFKLAAALCPDITMSLIDLAALATVADVVSLMGENRVIVALGLRQMNENPRPGISALYSKAGLKGEINAGHLGFQIGPRLNASGRVGNAQRSYDLLTCADEKSAGILAGQLEQDNLIRKSLEEEILKDAHEQLKSVDLAKACVLVLAGDWNVGVVGLAASRLVEEYHLPAVLLSKKEGMLTGSCRSILGVDIYECLRAVSEYLDHFGGHKQAAGLTLAQEHLEPFREALSGYIREHTDPTVFIPAAQYDIEAGFDELNMDFMRLLQKMQPCGFGNPAPVFRTQGQILSPRSVGKDGSHLSLNVEQNGRTMHGIYFGHGKEAQAVAGMHCDMLYTPTVNEYQNRLSIQFETKALRPSKNTGNLMLQQDEWEALLHEFLTRMLYNEIFIPQESWTEDQLLCALSESPRGNLILCADPDQAMELVSSLEKKGAAAPDVYSGCYPDDPRCWNALCLLPSGEPAEGYEHIWCLGAPAWLMAPGKQALQAGPPAEWLKELPDLTALRSLYRAARRILVSRRSAYSLPSLIRETAQASSLPFACASAGFLLLREMDLIAFSTQPAWAEMRPMQKVSPEKFPLFQRIEQLRGWEMKA